MPPKVKYTRDDVIKAAVGIVDERGLAELTARGLAGELGSSTAPVYKHFATMDELTLEVIKETQRTILEYTARPYTDRLFLNMGTGIAMFACEHKELYRALMLESDRYGDVVHEILDRLESDLAKDSRFTMLSADERHRLLHKMWTFTHGLASLICVGLIKECNQDKITRTLMDIGADVIGATLAKHANNCTTK